MRQPEQTLVGHADAATASRAGANAAGGISVAMTDTRNSGDSPGAAAPRADAQMTNESGTGVGAPLVASLPRPLPDARSDPAHDEALLVAAQAGDEAAFASIYDLWSGPLASYLYRLTSSREVADDLTQETFLRAWRALGRLERDTPLRPWLFRIATNLAHSHHRRQRLRTWLPFTSAPEPRAPDFTEQHIDAALLAQVLHAIGPTHGSILLLRHHLHLPLAEVATALSVSENTAKVRLYRARRAFTTAWYELAGDRPTTDGHATATHTL